MRDRSTPRVAKWFPKGFNGVVTCDRWRPYKRFAKRQLCGAHLERHLQAIIDGRRAGAEPGVRALSGADTMFETWHRFQDGHIRRDELQNLTASFRQQFKTFCTLGSRQKRDRKWRSLGRDLLRQRDAVFRFLDAG